MATAQPQVIRAETGQVFDIRLEGVLTSGYKWELDADGLADLLEPVADDVQPSAPSVVGGSATQSFRFRAITAGQTTVRFRYRRRWENVPIRETQVIVIIYDKNL